MIIGSINFFLMSSSAVSSAFNPYTPNTVCPSLKYKTLQFFSVSEPGAGRWKV